MSKAEILAELLKLEPQDRLQVFQRLCELQDDDLVRGVGSPTPQEKALLDEALAEFQRDGNVGTPWREAMRRIRASAGRA